MVDSTRRVHKRFGRLQWVLAWGSFFDIGFNHEIVCHLWKYYLFRADLGSLTIHDTDGFCLMFFGMFALWSLVKNHWFTHVLQDPHPCHTIRDILYIILYHAGLNLGCHGSALLGDPAIFTLFGFISWNSSRFSPLFSFSWNSCI